MATSQWVSVISSKCYQFKRFKDMIFAFEKCKIAEIITNSVIECATIVAIKFYKFTLN
jgi:hypothetical protein